MSDENSSEIECSVCLEGISIRATTPCKHSFCRGCLEKWAQAKRQVNPAGAVEAGWRLPIVQAKVSFVQDPLHQGFRFVIWTGPC